MTFMYQVPNAAAKLCALVPDTFRAEKQPSTVVIHH